MLEAVVQQAGHQIVAGQRGATTQDHAEQTLAVAHGGRGQVETGSVGETGLESVHARVAIHQTVVTAHQPATEREFTGGEIRCLAGEIAIERHRQLADVASRGGVIRVGQARGVAEPGMRHAQQQALGIHHLDEVILGATQLLGNHGGSIIGRFGDHAKNAVLHRDGLTGAQAELGRRLVRCPG